MGTTQDLHHEAANNASNVEGNSSHSETGDSNNGYVIVLLKLQALEFEKFQQEVSNHKQFEE